MALPGVTVSPSPGTNFIFPPSSLELQLLKSSKMCCHKHLHFCPSDVYLGPVNVQQGSWAISLLDKDCSNSLWAHNLSRPTSHFPYASLPGVRVHHSQQTHLRNPKWPWIVGQIIHICKMNEQRADFGRGQQKLLVLLLTYILCILNTSKGCWYSSQ